MIPRLSEYRKAVGAFVGTALANVLLVLPQDGGFGDLTTYQWVLIISTTLATTGYVAGVPNEAAGKHRA